MESKVFRFLSRWQSPRRLLLALGVGCGGVDVNDCQEQGWSWWFWVVDAVDAGVGGGVGGFW